MAPLNIDPSYSPGPGALGYSISHQKVELEIDLLSRSLRGRTEITVNPHHKELKSISLNCRQIALKRLSINGKSCSGVKYDDPYGRTRLPWKAGVHQYHLLQQRMDAQLKIPPELDLTVNIPKSVRIDALDPFSEESQNVLLSKVVGGSKRESGDASTIDITHASRSGLEQSARFTPISLYIEYETKQVRDGMQFVGWEEGDLRYPHAYSINSLSPGSACCLFPCLDYITYRCTWEISIKCPKNLGDSFKKNMNKPSQAGSLESNGTTSGIIGVHQTMMYEKHKDFSDEDQALEMVVVCTGEMTDEIVDPEDSTRKTTSFICATAISAQHVGFAIGPFEHVDLAEFRESDEDDRLGQNAVPVHGFCLPGRIEEVKNTCLPLAKAIDFFTVTYGSYPFSNYKLCFVNDLYSDIIYTGSLSICSTRLLFSEDIIEPLDRVSRQMIHAVASQWIGVNIVPRQPEDTWAVVGIAYFITDMFMKKLTGNNEYRYNQKLAADRVVDLDVERPSLFDTGALITLDPFELEFMILKAPLVLFILDRRLTKSGGSSGLARIVSRIFLSAKTGDLPDSTLDTPYFVKTCEKLGHLKLDAFFAQWLYGAGCPKFRVVQRFNKKKLVVEMSIHQVQKENVTDRDLESESFMRDVKEDNRQVYAGPLQPFFTGPMTIRIHEADGTPYEHIIDIKEGISKYDIPYNTKYKRLKRSRRQKERIAATAGNDYAGEGTDDVLLYSLGDTLQTEDEIREWRLAEWSKDQENQMSLESYEWVRMDADFEWICKMSVQMPPYMWVSQLQQDRDVVAQLESIQWLAVQNAHPLISTFCIRTLMDHRYFHGIRTAAAAVLAKNAREEWGWIGLFHLEKAFRELFCYPDSPMTQPNDFSDRTLYYIQCAIPQAISKIRDNGRRAPLSARQFLLEKLKFNDNSNNEFSDCHYLATLMKVLAEAVASKPPPANHESEEFEDDDGDDPRFHCACLEEIDRYRRIDEWIPSYHNVLSTTAIDCKRLLAHAGIIPISPSNFLQYTADGASSLLRINAFRNLMSLGTFKTPSILRYFLFVLGTDPSPYIRQNLLHIFGRTLGAIALGEENTSATAGAKQGPQDSLIIEQESTTEARAADIARKKTIPGAVLALKTELSSNPVLKTELWNAITSPAISLQQMGELLDICDLLYTPETSILVILKYPRYWRCTDIGKGKLLFSRSGRVRTTPNPKRQLIKSVSAPQPFIKKESGGPFIKRGSSGSVGAPRGFLKPPKKPSLQSAASTSSVEMVPEGQGEARPKLVLKFKSGKREDGGAGSPTS